jgi:hypothetical protein
MGGQAALEKMARQGGEMVSQADIAAESGLTEQINRNKLSGLSGLSDVEKNVAGLKLQGTGLLANVAGTQAGNVMQGYGMQRGLAGDVANARAAGVGQQVGLETGVAGGRRAAAGGLADLFATTGVFAHQDLGQALQAMGLDFSTEQNAVNSLVQLSKNPGKFQTAFGDIVSLISAAGGGPGIRKAITG